MGPCGNLSIEWLFNRAIFINLSKPFPTGSWPDPAARRGPALPAGKQEGACKSRRHEHASHIIHAARVRPAPGSQPDPARRPAARRRIQAGWVYRQIRERGWRARCRPARACRPRAAWRSAGASRGPRSRRLRPAARRRLHGRHGRSTYVAAVIPTISSARDCRERAGRPGARMQGTRRQGRAAPARLRGRAAGAPLPHEQPATSAEQAASDEPPFASRSADARAVSHDGVGAGTGRQRPAPDARPVGPRRAAGLAALREQIARLGRRAASSAMPRRSWCCPAFATAWTCAAGSLTPRDKVLIEDPGYVNAVPIYRPYTREHRAAAHR